MGAGCTVRVVGAGCAGIDDDDDDDDGAALVFGVEETVSADLKARTSRAIARQVRRSV